MMMLKKLVCFCVFVFLIINVAQARSESATEDSATGEIVLEEEAEVHDEEAAESDDAIESDEE